MYRLLLLASLALACVAEVVEPAESGNQYIQRSRHNDDNRHRDEGNRFDHHRIRYGNDDRKQSYRVNLHDDEGFKGPVILRTTNMHDNQGHGPDIARQNKIIADVFSPDYYQPTWILDYRYMKTGGRDYTRGPGGQYIILPKNIHTDEHKEFRDYDSLLEHLRLKNLAEKKEMQERFKAEEDEIRQRSRD